MCFGYALIIKQVCKVFHLFISIIMLKTYYYATKWEPAAGDYSKIVGADVTGQNFFTYADS